MTTIGRSEAQRFSDLRDMLECSAMRFGTCVAIHEKKAGFYQHTSYGRLFEEVEALGTALAALPKRSPRVLLLGKNSYMQTLSFLALLCGAGVPVPAPATLAGEAISALAARLGIDAVLCDGDLKERVAGLSAPVLTFEELLPLIEAGKKALAEGEYTVLDAPIDRDATAVIFPARSGGEDISLSHENMVETLVALAGASAIGTKDTFLSILPLCHAHEALLGLLLPLSAGASIAFGEGPRHLMRNMRQIHPTCMVVVPYLAERLYEKFWSLSGGREREIRRVIATTDPVRPLAARQAMKTRLLAGARAPFGGALRCLFVVGAPLTAMLSKGLRQIGIFAAGTYGLSECGVLGAITCPSAYLDGTAGKVLPDRLEIRDPQPDGSGEIFIRTSESGGHLTGARGRIDKDGFLHIVGKVANAIALGDGTVVSPEEAERLLVQSPLIREAAVVGIPTEKGVELAAMLVPDTESLAGILGEDHTEQQLEQAVTEWLADVNEGLSNEAKIALFALSDQPLPTDDSGAILVEEIVALLCAAHAESEETLSQEE